MPDTPIMSLTALPSEIIQEILSYLPKCALFSVRGVNHVLNSLATPWLVRSIRLQAYGHDAQKFIYIAESEKLRGLVREVTCDTWIGPAFQYRTKAKYRVPSDFLTALPFLGCLENVEDLHLRFNSDCGYNQSEDEIDETADVRYRVLDTIFQCLAGTWSPQRQESIDNQLVTNRPLRHFKMDKIPHFAEKLPISLKRLTVSNLADYSDSRLTESSAFKSVLASKSLVDLRLYIATETCGTYRLFDTISRDKHDMFELLPSTWLAPAVTEHLRCLSLYCHEWWGWYPKLDFRLVGAGKGLPNLKVLALGRYVFSHEWQADWVLSLGLDELYLDDCAVLHRACSGLSEDHSTTFVGKDSDGNDIVVSNEGYLLRDHPIIVNGGDIGWEDTDYGPVSSPIRWHDLLTSWREAKPAWRVFKMGYGAWDHAPEETVDAYYKDDPAAPSNHIARDYPFQHNAFRYFQCPTPSGRGGDKYRHGAGLSPDRASDLTYVYYNDVWDDKESWEACFREDEGTCWHLDDDVTDKDETAFELLVSEFHERGIETS